MLDNVKHHIPVPFTLPELMALYFSRDMLKIFKDMVFYESLDSLFKKVKTTLPPESLQYLKNIEQTLQVGIKPYKDYSKFKEIINRVNDAAVKKKRIEIVYFTQSRKKHSKRLLDPYRIWFYNGTFYLIGLCHVREEVRIFALDRIKMLSQTDEDFEIPEDFDLEAFMKPSFGVFHGETVRVKIWFSADIAGYIKEKIWHESQNIHTRKDGSIIFEAEVSGTDEIKFWIMSWGSKALVLEPESLKKRTKSRS